ncbi:hypothetical protein BT63DRAFT_111953 [Microthyrium microscopicum]|uniref:C2H2-type domain-containing protein n=1 Tax=Microthyrium microscopicum TaxID=703497 RepID=A0A6A6TX79_9PEZI|nr:hypothetical protein BT63DRAFT_111953 [Microthyrium microscopicum]
MSLFGGSVDSDAERSHKRQRRNGDQAKDPFLWRCPYTSCDLQFIWAQNRLKHLQRSHWKGGDPAAPNMPEEEKTRRPNQVLSLYDGGNYIVTLGSKEEGLLEVAVSSEALSIASPVWRVLMSGGRAGHQFKEAVERQASFVEDDPDSMLLLFSIAHMEFNRVPKVLEIDQLHALAVTCNKYDCANRVTPWARSWMGPTRKSLPNRKGNRQKETEFSDLRVPDIAWTFGDTETFQLATKLLLDNVTHGNAPGTIDFSDWEDEDDVIVPQYNDCLLQARERILNGLCGVFDEAVNRLSSTVCEEPNHTGCHPFALGYLVRGLRVLDIWPVRVSYGAIGSINFVYRQLRVLAGQYPKEVRKVESSGICENITTERPDGLNVYESLEKILLDGMASATHTYHLDRLRMTNRKLKLFPEN